MLKKLAQPRPLFRLIRSFQTNKITIFTTDQCEKMSCSASIQRQDLNPRPSEREPPPITTRPGLTPELPSGFTWPRQESVNVNPQSRIRVLSPLP